jgi:hypothetical protein
MANSARRAKLPLRQAVQDSYAWGFQHIGEVIAKGWMILAALAAISLAGHWLAFPYEKAAEATGGGWFSWLFVPLTTIIFTSMIAVPWHRFVLDNEPLPLLAINAAPRVLAYIVWGVLLSMPLVVAFGLLTVTGAAPQEESALINANTIRTILGVGGMLLSVYLTVRLGIKLVAVALGDSGATLAAIWRATPLSFWRLFWGTTVTVVPVFAVAISAAWVLGDNPSRPAYAVVNALATAAELPLGLVSLTFLSLAYRHFMRAR